MTGERYAQLKQTLEGHRHRLHRSLAARLGDVRAHGDRDRGIILASDDADASASAAEQEFGVALAELAAQALRQVDQALARLESGDYGFCVDCDGPIAHQRLRALPFAARCLECAELHENDERMRRASSRSHGSRLTDD